jgi:protein-S-isoprenylcysteine O-methyltransferase Ste14
MAKRGFLRRQGIVRNAIKEDLLGFALPAILIFAAGMLVSALDGWEGLVVTIDGLTRQPQHLSTLSLQNIVGLALIVLGFAIELTGHITLRRFHSSTLVILEDHQLITHGVYRFVRHPIYLGAIMVTIGIPVYTSSLVGFLIMLALIPVLLNRIRIEERLLTAEFGEAYRTYKESTRKLIPFIY